MTSLIALSGKGPEKIPPQVTKAELCVAADGGAELAARLGIRPNLVVGDFDSLSPQTDMEPMEIEKHPADKDESDAELAMKAAKRMGSWTWTVVGGSGGRFDHVLGLLHLARLYPEWKQWWLEEDVVYFLRKDEELFLKGRPGMRLSVFCHSDREKASLESKGLKWRLDELDWIRRVSLSNELADNEIRLRVLHGMFLVIRPLEDAFEFSF